MTDEQALLRLRGAILLIPRDETRMALYAALDVAMAALAWRLAQDTGRNDDGESCNMCEMSDDRCEDDCPAVKFADALAKVKP